MCTSEKKRRKKNHSNRKAVEEHAKIACRFRYYECCSALTFGRSFLVFDDFFLHFFDFFLRFSIFSMFFSFLSFFNFFLSDFSFNCLLRIFSRVNDLLFAIRMLKSYFFQLFSTRTSMIRTADSLYTYSFYSGFLLSECICIMISISFMSYRLRTYMMTTKKCSESWL